MSKHPSHPSNIQRPGSSSQVLESAALALRMQRPDEAERLAFGVLKSDRGNLVAAQILGRALLMQNRADEAIVQLERAARRSDDAQIETLLVVALAAIARGDEALDRLRRAIARRPPFPPAFLEYASQLGKIGRVDEAIAVLESGLALSPMRSGISISNATAAPRRALFFRNCLRQRRSGTMFWLDWPR
jgi:tetratricopeptide (TPR) repeat protein